MQQQTNSTIRPLVYIVDDEPMIGELVGLFLRREGMAVEIFDQPKAALAAFRVANPKPAVLLTDFRMPGISGLELIKECKALHPELRTISISGTMNQSDMEEAGISPDRLVRKPFALAELRKPLAELLGASAAAVR
ncbi:MAG: response regulator [Verrucomicrobiota bacterium]